MNITKQAFGGASLYILTNDQGMRVEISDFGGIIRSVVLPSGLDVVLGYDTLEEYLSNGSTYFGSLIGRVANRIEGSAFTLNDTQYSLYANNGRNSLHGGRIGFNQKLFAAEILEDGLRLSYTSPEGEEGYPGTVKLQATYRLGQRGDLSITYDGVSDADTPINITNHSYFNLNGHESGSIEGQRLRMYADRYTFNSSECLPTGQILPVTGSEMDFREEKEIGRDIGVDTENMKNCGGYDHNFIFVDDSDDLKLGAEAAGHSVIMQMYTTKPGVQLYTGNFINEGTRGKNGAVYAKRSGFCLETQYYPNALQHSHFPSIILKAGETYHHETVYVFREKE